MEKNETLYWKYLKLWIASSILFFVSAGAIGFIFRENNPEIIIPITLGILFLPLIITGIYGLRNGYSGSHRIGHICRGTKSIAQNSFLVALYVCVLAYAVFRDGAA